MNDELGRQEHQLERLQGHTDKTHDDILSVAKTAKKDFKLQSKGMHMHLCTGCVGQPATVFWVMPGWPGSCGQKTPIIMCICALLLCWKHKEKSSITESSPRERLTPS